MRKSNKIQLNCMGCGTVFFRTPSNIKQGRSKYCSLSCTNKSFKRTVVFTCDFCKKEFESTPGNRNNPKKYCSPICFAGGKSPSGRKLYLKIGERYAHAVIAEQYLGRELVKGETVHHIDEDIHNNDFTNLAVLPSASIHHKVHYSGYDFEEYKLINLIKKQS